MKGRPSLTYPKSLVNIAVLVVAAGLTVICLVAPGTPQHAQNGPSTNPRYYYQQAIEAHKKKDYQAFLRNIQEALRLRPNQPVYIYNLAAAHALMTNKQEALKWLRRVAEMGMAYAAEKDEDFDSIKDSEEYPAILKRFALNRAPINNSSLAFTVKEQGLVPEGIAFDPRTGHYYLSSVHRRKILKIDQKGTATEFATEKDGVWGVMGMKVDASRRLLWVTTTAVPQMENYRKEEDGSAGVLKFDLTTGKLIKKYLLLNQPQKHWLGDLAIDSRGQVFATDSLTPAIYVIRQQRDELEVLLDRGPFISPQGVTFTPDEKSMFVADYSLGVFIVNLRTKECSLMPSATDAALVGIDGLYYHRGSLIGIQNGTNPHRVVRLSLSRRFDRIERLDVMEANNVMFDEPTLGVVANGWLYYIADSQWGKIDGSGKFKTPELLRDVAVLKIKL
jgi:hypothetical protein